MSSNALRERRSFAKLAEVLPPPNLISVQKESFAWFLDKGLGETLRDISPVEDFTGNLALQFISHRFEEPKFDEDECKEKDMTFSRPLFVTAAFINKETGEIKEQTVFMGDFPMMTDKGTFIINGTERVVVSQLVRSPGVYFDKSIDKTADKDIFACKVIPARGAWLEFETDKKDLVGVRIDRKRKQNVTVLLKALGYGDDQAILDLFDGAESIQNTLEKDAIQTEEDALMDIYRKLRPGEPPTVESARSLLDNLFFNAKRYDLAKVGRYKVNKKLGFKHDEKSIDAMGTVLRKEDILATIQYLVKLHAGDPDYEVDDIDHFGNRRIRPVGELIQNQIRVGLSRMERVVRERMTTQDVEAITPQTLINIRPVVASIKEFFGSSQLSQFLDQTNPLTS
ncbi:MAG TPA: DNA-directed RNA polymerase subunit beta, partial [Actinomycetota bacterium]|nr:DNA-directed RNA polymerase subunit beta [Actinomycetota bacterium]